MYIQLNNSITKPNYLGQDITYNKVRISKVNIYPLKRILHIYSEYYNDNGDNLFYKQITKVDAEYDNLTFDINSFYQLILDSGIEGTIQE